MLMTLTGTLSILGTEGPTSWIPRTKGVTTTATNPEATTKNVLEPSKNQQTEMYATNVENQDILPENANPR